jgi:hypothetical protein
MKTMRLKAATAMRTEADLPDWRKPKTSWQSPKKVDEALPEFFRHMRSSEHYAAVMETTARKKQIEQNLILQSLATNPAKSS